MRVGPLLLAFCLWLSASPVTAQRGATKPAPMLVTKEGPLVTAARVSVDLAAYQGPCPAKLRFTGTITASAPLKVPVSYQWVRSDGVKGRKRSIRMTGTTATVSDQWKLGASGQMMRPWSELHILSPNRLVSNQIGAQVLCR